jgi:RNA polymerase sigma-70 factor (ECF subfamily)
MTGEAELIGRFAAGEPAGVAEVYRRYGRLVYLVSHRVLGDSSLAEEATRRTFLLAWRLVADLPTGRAVAPWLVDIAGRTAMDIRDQEHRRPRDLDGPTGDRPEPAAANPVGHPDRDAWLVRHALDTLPTLDRELIRLQHHGRLSRHEISERLAIPVDSVQSRSERAHRNLAHQLGRLRSASHHPTSSTRASNCA